jgi:NADP-dependent 3-hydroxy acid dehydrogenase YdfG
MKTLKDKVIVITGAGGAMAGAVIEAFYKAGARLQLVDRDVLRIEGRASSYGITPCQEDLMSFESAQRVVGEAKRQFSKVDGLVHLVGDVVTGSVLETSFEDYSRVFARTRQARRGVYCRDCLARSLAWQCCQQ